VVHKEAGIAALYVQANEQYKARTEQLNSDLTGIGCVRDHWAAAWGGLDDEAILVTNEEVLSTRAPYRNRVRARIVGDCA